MQRITIVRISAMKLPMRLALVLICLVISPLNSRAASVPNEANCRSAISAFFEQVRYIPPNVTERDNRDRKKLLAEMERIVETNRRQGISECQTWGQIMGKAFNQ
jgi:hypothetical protein